MTGAELSMSSSEAGSFKDTLPLSNPVERKKVQEENKYKSTEGII